MHAFKSSQGTELLVCLQPPTPRQVSVVQPLLSSQSKSLPAAQAPPVHTSPTVQALPSSHGALFGTNWQPNLGSQLSVVQGFPSLQATGVPPPQLPVAQVSATVQGLPSSQAAVLAVCAQFPVISQVSTVHGLPSSQSTAAPLPQAPLLQRSPTVHAKPSSQGAWFCVKIQPVCGEQPSSVQGLPSEQAVGLPAVQVPLKHCSPTVQASPSSQLPALGSCSQPPLG